MKKGLTYSKSEKTRQFIIEQVAPIFNKKGVAGTSLSDLTAATGLTKGSIYGNFKNKDEVAVEAFKHNLAISAYGFITEITASTLTPIEKLRLIAKGYRKRYDTVIEIGGCPILNTASDTDDTHPQLKKMVQDAVFRIENSLVAIIEEGIAQKQIKLNTNPKKIAEVMISLIEGGFMTAKLLGERKYFENSLDYMVEIIDGISI